MPRTSTQTTTRAKACDRTRDAEFRPQKYLILSKILAQLADDVIPKKMDNNCTDNSNFLVCFTVTNFHCVPGLLLTFAQAVDFCWVVVTPRH